MKKRFLTLLLAALLALALAIPGLAADGMPDWYPDDVSSFEDFHAVDAPRVVDDADMFTDEEEAALSEKISDVIAAHGFDLVLYTAPSTYGLSHRTLAADFYQFCGYGLGDDFDGSVLLICMDPADRGWYTAICGASRDYFTSERLNRIDDAIEPLMISGDYYGAMERYFDEVDALYARGFPGKEPVSIGFPAFAGVILGLIVGFIAMAVLVSQMKPVRRATHAAGYLKAGSFRLRSKSDHYLYSTVTKRLHPKDNGGSSGGKSNFTRSHSSSGGRSFSGGGRKF